MLLNLIKLETARGRGRTSAVIEAFKSQALDLTGEKRLKRALSDLPMTDIKILRKHKLISNDDFAWLERLKAKRKGE